LWASDYAGTEHDRRATADSTLALGGRRTRAPIFTPILARNPYHYYLESTRSAGYVSTNNDSDR
jgi:hypothetical protein